MIRVLCMGWVCLFHAMIHCGFSVGIESIDKLVSIGAAGCQGFFMISGFMLRKKYRDVIWTKDLLKKYLFSRLIGIYPVYGALTFLAILTKYRFPDGIRPLLNVLPMQLSLLQVWFFPSSYPIMFNDNFWFLSVLFTLYLLFPALNCITNMLSSRTKKILCILLPIVSFYCYYICISLGQAFQAYYMSPLLRIFEFWLGSVIFDIADESSMKMKGRTVFAATVLCMSMLLLIYPRFSTNYNLYNIILLPYFAFLLFSAYKNPEWGHFPPVQYLSECGLSIYSCQSITILLKPFFTYYRGIAYVVVTLIAAVIIHEIVEKPLKWFFQRVVLPPSK